MRHRLFRRFLLNHLQDSFVKDGMDHREIAFRMRHADDDVIQCAIAKARVQKPEFGAAIDGLELTNDAIGDGTIWERVVAFFKSDFGQLLIQILKSLLLLLPFILTPAPMMLAGPVGRRPVRDALFVIREVELGIVQFEIGNYIGPGGCLQIIREILEHFQEPE